MEEVSSVQNSVTSRPPNRRLMGEVGGSDGQLMLQNVEQTKFHVVVEDVEEGKIALVARKNNEKGKLQMDLIIDTSWISKDHSAPMEDSTSLVGKSVEMPGTISGVSHPKRLG